MANKSVVTTSLEIIVVTGSYSAVEKAQINHHQLWWLLNG